MGTVFLICFGVIIQIVLLVSIFDIYFTSPIVRGIAPLENSIQGLSKRVVVISVDGLRLDALLEDEPNTHKPIAPYIRWSMEHRGTWGVSHCHLPTESRPGHVAMLAGFYEDPSAVTKGWKENPVDFDSIFNKSTCSFAWGSPDIVNIFYKGLQHNCSYKFVYNENQNFAGNTMELDNWVLNELKHFFMASGNPIKYSTEKSLFFLHLLGQDTSGHTHKPKTEKYRENLRNVDRIVREIDVLFNQMFMDNATSFVLTADHGMTDWGSHGAGDDSETTVPLVAWGKGIRHSKSKKVEIDQADITPLLAILIGSSIPVNSIGILPTEFLNATASIEAQALFLNARQIFASFMAKKTEIEVKSPWLLYKKFETDAMQNLLNVVTLDVSNGKFSDAKSSCFKLIKLALQGIDFYQNYFQNVLFALTSITFILWIVVLFVALNGVPIAPKFDVKNIAFLVMLSLPASFIVYHQNLSISYHAYLQLPIILFWLLLPLYQNVATFISELKKIQNILYLILFIFGIEVFVVGFFNRAALSLSLLAIILTPLVKGKISIQKDSKLISTWVFSGLTLAIFTILPVVGKQPYPITNLFASILISIANLCITLPKNFHMFYKSFLVLAAGVNSYWVQSSISNDSQLSYLNQYLSWFLLVHLPYLLAQPSKNALEKLTSIFISLSIPFILLTVSHESIFLITLFINLTCWQYIEIKSSDSFKNFLINYVRPSIHDNVTILDFRLAYVFLTYIYVAFFGIGNLATLNSFDPAWVRCFLTTFSPFTMTALILFKVVIPFFAVTTAFRVVTIITYLEPFRVFVCLLIYCNWMGLNFLYLVRNEGSWLDIGTSLSHYVIQQVAIVFLLILYALSQVVISNDLVPTRSKSL